MIGDSEESPETMDNHMDRPEVLSAVSGEIGSSQQYSRTLAKRMMYLALPLENGEKIRFSEGPIRNILRSSIQICQAKANAKKINVELSCNNSVTVTVNAALLEQALAFVKTVLAKKVEKALQCY